MESGRLAGVGEPEAVGCELEESLRDSNMRMMTVRSKEKRVPPIRACIVANRMPEGLLPFYLEFPL